MSWYLNKVNFPFTLKYNKITFKMKEEWHTYFHSQQSQYGQKSEFYATKDYTVSTCLKINT